MIIRSRWRGLPVAALTLALLVAVCGIAPPPGAVAAERGCPTGTAVENVSAKAQVEAPTVLPCDGQDVLRPTAIGHLLPPADAQVPTALPSEDVSSRAPPVSL